MRAVLLTVMYQEHHLALKGIKVEPLPIGELVVSIPQ